LARPRAPPHPRIYERNQVTDSTDGPQVRPFAAVLTELAKGQIHADASEQLHDLVDAVQEHGKKGTLTIRIEVAPIARDDTSVLVVKGSVESRAPKSPPSSAYFVDGTGNLSRRDPRQTELPLEVVGSNSARSATQ
jgi:hypothetical protein